MYEFECDKIETHTTTRSNIKKYDDIFSLKAGYGDNNRRFVVKIIDQDGNIVSKFVIRKDNIYIHHGIYFKDKVLKINRSECTKYIEKIMKINCEKAKDEKLSFDVVKNIIPTNKDIIDFVLNENIKVKIVYDFIIGLIEKKEEVKKKCKGCPCEEDNLNDDYDDSDDDDYSKKDKKLPKKIIY